MIKQLRKILVIQTAFIGDAILATSLLEELHHYYPDAALHLVVRKGNEALFIGHPYLQKLWVWDKKQSKYKHLFQLIKAIRKEKFDLVVNLQRFMATGIITMFSKGKTTVGFGKNPLSVFFKKRFPHVYGIHEVKRNHSLVSELTGDKVFLPRLYPSEADEQKVKDLQTRSYITIAPASVWFTKQFPVSKWIEFLDSITSSLQVYLLGGPGDEELCHRIVMQVKNPNLGLQVMAGKVSFLQTAVLMKGARMNYVNDSAPLHIASSMNAPVRAIFCSTIADFGFGPLSDDGRIVEIEEDLYCRPCGLHGKKACPEGHFRCALEIKVPAEL